MNKNKSMVHLLVFGILLSIASCTSNFLDYNTDPKGITKDEAESDDYFLTSLLLGMQDYVIPTSVNTCQFTDCLLGGSFGGYLSDSNNGFNGKNYSTYNPEEHWVQVVFNDIIPNVFVPYNEILNLTEDPILKGVSNILKVMAISRVTDVYGPIPYSKVGQDNELNSPYDSQEDVYKLMLEELDEAITSLTHFRTEDFNPNADNVYKGNVVKWIKLANSMKLRLAMRMAYANPALAQTKAEEAANHEIGTIVSNADNAMKPIEIINPFRRVMYDYNSGDSRISADIASYMNGYKDPRREKYFTLSTFKNRDNGYFGLRSGIQIPTSDEIKQYANMNVDPDSKLLWMNAAEVAFLRAEGSLRGWNMGTPSISATDNAEGFYRMGIKLSFEQWGASGVDAYMDNVNLPDTYKDPMGLFSYDGITSRITVKWDNEDEFESKLEKIITQKWIAIFPLGLEAWSEYRRTGYPKLMEVVQNNSGGKVDPRRMARRLQYPQNEYDENRANLRVAVEQYLKGPDNMGTDVWWAKRK